MGNNPKGPCSELFKRAFECFVKNQESPEKCTNKMQKMQNCQKKHPHLYEETNNN
jgi:hypothetical protein